MTFRTIGGGVPGPPVQVLMADGATWAGLTPVVKRVNLCTNPNFEAIGANTVVTRTNMLTNPRTNVTVTGWAGVVVGGGFTQASPYSGNVGALAGESWRVSADLTAGSVGFNGTFAGHGTTGGSFGTNTLTPVGFSIPAGTTQRVNVTHVIGTGADGLRIYLNVPAGTEGKIDRAVIEKGTTDGSYFDGSTAATADLVYSWTGAANASTSVAKGQAVAGWQFQGGEVGTRATVSAWQGLASARLANPGGAEITTLTNVAPPYCSLGAGLLYSFAVRARGDGKIVLKMQSFPNAVVFATGVTVALTDAWQTLAVTGTLAAGQTSVAPLIYHAVSLVGQPCVAYVDGVIFEEGAGLQPYFDGNTPADRDYTYSWSGAANASTSEARP